MSVTTDQPSSVHPRTLRRFALERKRERKRRNKKAQRDRAKKHRWVIPVEASDLLVEELIRAGYLDESAQDDRATVGTAVSRLLDLMLRAPLPMIIAEIEQLIHSRHR
jgi:hypothetical protein